MEDPYIIGVGPKRSIQVFVFVISNKTKKQCRRKKKRNSIYFIINAIYLKFLSPHTTFATSKTI
jgi:hypothetical protein